MSHVQTISEQFCDTHRIEIKSKGVFPGWHSQWIVDGREMSTRHVRQILIPMVREAVGPDPKTLKAIIWKILIKHYAH